MIYFNDASLHGQFAAFEPFCESLRTIWNIRKALVGKGLSLNVCRGVRLRKVTDDKTFNDFLGNIPRDIKNRLLVWLDREGPFWDDQPHHSCDEYFESCGEVVTDTGVAEAACIQTEGMPTWIFSIYPSKCLKDPLEVSWLGRSTGDLVLSIPNGWELEHVDRCASEFDHPFTSWKEMIEWAERECENLLISPDVIGQLPIQFIPNVAQRSKVLLGILDKIVGYQKKGKDQESLELQENWMQGNRARFANSSNSEINDFRSKLTFKHPSSDQSILCSWHGKIQTPQFRIHFEWPLPHGEEKLFIAYIGPKITKR
jgi:hypothetical protein